MGIGRYAPPPLDVDDSIVEAMQAWGAPPEAIAKAQALAAVAPPEEKPYYLWHDNARAFELFLAVRSQWVYAGGMAVQRIGLSYEGVRAYLLINVPRRFHRALMHDLQAMEVAVLGADAELRKQQEENES